MILLRARDQARDVAVDQALDQFTQDDRLGGFFLHHVEEGASATRVLVRSDHDGIVDGFL